MKQSILNAFRIGVVLSVLVPALWAGQTMYGASGYGFVPDGFVDQGPNYGGFFAGEYVAVDRMRLYPKYIGLRWTGLSSRIELTLSNTYAFVGDQGFSPLKKRMSLFPIIPAIKWSVEDIDRKYVRWALAAGAMAPYGVYGMMTVRSKTPVLQPELSVGIGTILTTTYGLAGGRMQFADLQGKPLPLCFTADAGWAGYMERLGAVREAFYSLGSEVNMGRNILFVVTYRKDPRDYVDFDSGEMLSGQNRSGRWSLKLDYRFDGVKHVEGGVK